MRAAFFLVVILVTAAVHADAILGHEGQAQRHNIDYFTLIEAGESWKILNGSYVSLPPESEMK